MARDDLPEGIGAVMDCRFERGRVHVGKGAEMDHHMNPGAPAAFMSAIINTALGDGLKSLVQ